MIEINLLKNLDHINIVKYHGFIQKMSNLYIILEYASKGSLKNLMSTRVSKCLTEAETKMYIRQTLNGLAYLHGQGVIHRDIKAANLLLDADNIVKLADFGVSTRVNNAAMTLAGSLNWMAPEIITNKGASTLSDIWSLGATVVELLTGKPPFHNLLDINIYYAMENEKEKYYPPASLSEETKQFLQLCLQKNMFERSTAKDLLNHPWIAPILSNDDRLDRYKEEFSEDNFNWDADFKENEIDSLFNTENNSPRRGLANSSPLKPTPLKKNWRQDGLETIYSSPLKNQERALFHDGRNNKPRFDKLQQYQGEDIDDFSADIDDSLLYDGYYYLNLLQESDFKLTGKDFSEERIKSILADCTVEDITFIFFELLQKDKILSDATTILARLLANDIKENNSKVINQFLQFGGGPLLANSPIFVSQWYKYHDNNNNDHFFKILIQNGIMNGGNIGQFTSNEELYFDLVYNYLEYTSMKFWYKWCRKNIDTSLLVRCMHSHNSKKIQSIILKLASMDSNINKGGERWLLKSVLPVMVEQPVTRSSQISYILFKTIAYLLQHSSNPVLGELTKQANVTRKSSASSMSGTVSMTPMMHSPTKPQRILSNQYFRAFNGIPENNNNENVMKINDPNTYYSLPKPFPSWLLKYLESFEIVMMKNNNIHVWKYFIKVCYISSKIDKTILIELVKSSKFVDLINYVLKRYEEVISQNKLLHHNNQPRHDFESLKQIQRNLKSSIQTLILLLVDISRLETYKDISSTNTTNLDKIILNISRKFEEFLPLCIEYLLNAISVNNSYRGKDDELQNIITSLADAFYRFEADDVSFNSVVNKFITLCSLDNASDTVKFSRALSEQIVSNIQFVGRVKLFFKLYENSLLIQIELLKLIKLLFSQGNHSRETMNQTTDFLKINWKQGENGTPSERQVGRDSILILQLCNDIANM